MPPLCSRSTHTAASCTHDHCSPSRRGAGRSAPHWLLAGPAPGTDAVPFTFMRVIVPLPAHRSAVRGGDGLQACKSVRLAWEHPVPWNTWHLRRGPSSCNAWGSTGLKAPAAQPVAGNVGYPAAWSTKGQATMLPCQQLVQGVTDQAKANRGHGLQQPPLHVLPNARPAKCRPACLLLEMPA